MKTWKMAGCLLLLCVIICGCVVMGKSTEVSAAQTQPSDGGEQEEQTEQTPEASAPTEKEEAQEGSTTVSKSYSEGLYFRSNGDGTCALAGMGSCTAACVLIPPQSPAGDTVTEILPNALAGSIVGAVEIPTTVKVLSAASFSHCDRLAYVRVAAGNEAFIESDGALYTADGSMLVYCPAGRSARSLTLHANVRRIAAGAFASCIALDTIYFTGTTAEWHNIIVGDENNALYAARLCFTAA
ncbi:MAG: hypothetical protein J6A84_04075 [Clostridia bacterium]|nr:hypothetical protein [Clostridia bacterium]